MLSNTVTNNKRKFLHTVTIIEIKNNNTFKDEAHQS